MCRYLQLAAVKSIRSIFSNSASFFLLPTGSASLAKKALRNSALATIPYVESLSMFARFIHWGILAIGILMGLSMIGLPITHLAILVSALSVGIGFGLQTIVNNSVAGLILISERAVSLGDIIATPSGHIGRVTMITIRATRIVTPTGQAIIIPNASLINGSFTNFTMDRRGVRKIYPFSIPYGIDFRKVKEIIEKAAVSVPLLY